MPKLCTHRGTLYHRSIIPKSLRHFFDGKVQSWRSLGHWIVIGSCALGSAGVRGEAIILYFGAFHDGKG